MRRQGVCGIDVGHARPRNQDMYSNKQLSLGERCPQIAIEKVLDVVLLGLWDVEMPTTYDVLPFSRPPLSESMNSSLNFTIPILIYYLFFVKFYAYIKTK